MRTTLYLWALVLLILPSYVFTQTKDDPHGIASRAIFHNYEWPSKTVENLRISDFKSGFEFEYYRFLNNQFNLSFPLRINNGLLLVDENGTQFKAGSIGLDALINFKIIKEGWLRPQLFTGTGLILEDLKDISVVIPIGMGFDFQIGRNSFFSIASSYRLSLKDNRNHLQLGAGLRFNIAPRNKDDQIEQQTTDRDKDGIPDHEDLCPDEAGVDQTNGCPDTDKDGVIDINDHCPNISGPKTFNGCPDTDKDGLIDMEDDCPLHAGPVRNSGCPYAYANRTTIKEPNASQLSEEQVGAKKKQQSRNQEEANSSTSSKLPKTNNRNKILDSSFSKNTNESVNDSFSQDAKKHHNYPPINDVDKQILIDAVQSIEFETGSAIIKKSSYNTLNDVSAVMQRNASYQLLIEGHTDSIGSRSDNQFLSERRALACFNYLLMEGMDRSRMKYTGYGESRPIDSNILESGRELNRRVEFNLFMD